jgi:hypothetical protein
MQVDEREEEEQELLPACKEKRESSETRIEPDWKTGKVCTVKASQTSCRFRNSKLTLGVNARRVYTSLILSTRSMSVRYLRIGGENPSSIS